MKKRLWHTIICTLLLLLTGTVEAQKRSYSNTLLWRITGNNLQKPSYLFGTMHLEDRRLFQFGDSLYHCLEKAEGFAMEVNPDSAMIALFKSMNEPDTTGLLKDVLSKKDLERVGKPIQKKYGISPEKITRKQAWMYSYNRVKGKRTDDMDTPVDTYLYNVAKRQGKWVGGIEDIKDQFNLIEEIGTGLDLSGTGTEERNGRKLLDRLIDIYLAQNLNGIRDWTNSMDENTRDEMLIRRNFKMAFRMDSMARIRSNFFAVGAAHLPGKDGLIELLEQKGFTVEPIFSSKKIAPEKYTYQPVELEWHKTQDKKKTFTVEMPGQSYPLEVDGMITMETYADMGSGLIFLATSVRSGKKSVDPDSMLARIAKNISGNQKILNKRTIELNGTQGLEAFAANETHFYRLQGFIKENIIFLTMSGATKRQLLTSEDANRFHQSLVIQDNIPHSEAKDNSWKSVRMEKHGLEFEVPGVPERNHKLEANFNSNPASANWSVNCYTVSDVEADVFYMLFVRDTKPGYHVLNDSLIFAESKTNVENSFADSVSFYELFNFQGFPAMRMQAAHKENEFVMQSVNVNRGDRCYSLIAIGNVKNNNEKDFDHFLNSVKLTNYDKVEWKRQISPGKVFQTWAPSSIGRMNDDEDDEKETVPGFGTLVTSDSLSGYSFAVERELISPYYWTDSDSSFFESHVSQYIGWQDSVIEKKTVQNGAVKGMEYFIKSPTISSIKRVRLLPYCDTLFVVFCLLPASDIRDNDHNKFFTEFRFLDDVACHNFLKNKTSNLLQDLLSDDSARFHSASDAIVDAPFSVADLPLLHEAMLNRYQDFDEYNQCTHDEILSSVVTLKHPSTVEFIQKNYSRLSGKNEQLKYSFLSVLARNYTAESYKLFSKLALDQTPASGNARMLQHYLQDSLLLTASLFPAILKLTADTNFIKCLPTIVNQLIDSNLLSLAELKPYRENFYEYARREVLRLGNTEEYDYLTYSLIELLTRINQPESNQLLQKLLGARQLNVKEAAAVGLIKNKQSVEAAQLDKIASDKNYRSSLYSKLAAAGKQNLFPSRFSSQRSIAESEIFVSASDDYEPSSIQFIGEKTAMYQGANQKFMLFKIVFSSEEGDRETYLGIAGPYPVKSKKIITDPKGTGVYTDESFNAKKLEEHLKLYLQQLAEYPN